MGRIPHVVIAFVALAAVTVAAPSTAAATAEPNACTPTTAAVSSPQQGRSELETQTGLSMQITRISPAGLEAGRPIRMSGTVTNLSAHAWTDAKVYLSMGFEPAVTKSALDAFAADDDGFGNTVNSLGLFDEIGRLPPGSRTTWHLHVPFADLPISGTAGVYQVGATLLAGTSAGRDTIADARVATTIPFLPSGTTVPHRTHIVTLIPVTAPVLRNPDGSFIDDRLAGLFAPGGRLRDVVDFAGQAPPGSIEVLVDPALREAAKAMSAGYDVRSLAEDAIGAAGHAGSGQQDAAAWLAELDNLTSVQHVTLLPWGDPATSSLAAAHMRGVVSAAVRASKGYATGSFGSTVVDWQYNGSATRRALAVARLAGTSVHVVSQDSLPDLPLKQPSGYPPAVVSVRTRPGPATTVVSRGDIGGQQFDASLTALQFRQSMLAEATVRSLSGDHRPSVFAAPFTWDPGDLASQSDLAAGYSYPTVAVASLADLTQRMPRPYSGRLRLVRAQPRLSAPTFAAIRRLRHNGRVYGDLVNVHDPVSADFDRQLAAAGSAAWSFEVARGTAVTRELAKQLSGRIARVTVTGPAFVTMSSDTGRFPLTVTNGLSVPVTVRVTVSPLNRALKIAPLKTLHLSPGQFLDVEVKSTADGTGLTQVRARLTTVSDRSFGKPFTFNVRATQIGLAIWIVIGVGVGVLAISAGRRIYARARGRGFKTRGESSA
jgi:hypothetical protein